MAIAEPAETPGADGPSLADFPREFARQALDRVGPRIFRKVEAPIGGGPKS